MKKLIVFLAIGLVVIGLAPQLEARGSSHGGFRGGGHHGGSSFNRGGSGFHRGGNFNHGSSYRSYNHGPRHHYRGHYRGGFYSGFGSYGYGGFGYPYGYGGYGYRPYYTGAAYAQGYNRGLTVADIQQALAGSGYYRGRVDGVLGSYTRQAIRNFQANNGLRATGRIDSQLVRALRLS